MVPGQRGQGPDLRCTPQSIVNRDISLMAARSKKPATPPDTPTGGKRARTRASLIDAAAEVIGQKGLDRTSLEDIAAHAGMSRGAIYGNFRNKEELFLAVAASRWKPIIPPASPPGTSFRKRMHLLGESVAAAAAERRTQAAGAISFVLYALTHEELRLLLGRSNEDIYAMAAARMRDSIPERQMPMPAEQLVRVIHAMTEGLITMHALTPHLVTRETIVAAFEALA
ncbi:MAG: TetR family transcriptional regulator [Gemmatimonadetes bacterium]|nr:TetR family transcriptional regulator [Gemmatimonadota bacterium]